MNRKNDLTRREFLQRAVAGSAALGLTGAAGALESTTGTALSAPTASMPMRTLGKTGEKVSLLGFGGGSRFLVATPEAGAEMLEAAIKAGITYFDTAANYGKERASEKRFGLTLPAHRKNIFLATKTAERGYDGAMRSVEESLKNLNADKLDLIQMHAANEKDDPAAWEKPGGALTALRKLRDEKVVRYIGFTGHDKAEVHRKIIETLDFDTVLMALNAADHKSFREIALPAAVEKKMGIIAMKTTKGLVGEGKGKATPAELLQWAFDLPVTTVIIGMESLQILQDNIRIAKAHKQGASDGKGLAARLKPHVTAEQLVWAMPGYQDAFV